jgi:hypothetical protein
MSNETDVRPLNYIETVEIVETWATRANEYLSNGYRLLGIFPVSDLRKKGNTEYVRRTMAYVVGRSIDVRHYEPKAIEKAPVEAGI